MKKIIFLIILIIFSLNIKSYADGVDCKNIKKFSLEYFKCKGKQVKDKAISTSKNIVKDTKDYQEKEWAKEKKN